MATITEPDGFEAFTVAWIAALPHERAAGTMMLDDRYKQPQDFIKNRNDPNSYTWGRIGNHNIVIASLPAGEYGVTTTAITVQGLLSSLPHIRIGLLVGIGAGVPGEKHTAEKTVTVQRDIRLGDVVVSNPDGTNGGVIQYDFVKAKQSRERKGFLNSPPQALRNALSALQAEHELEDSKIVEFIADSARKYPKVAKNYFRPAINTDRLFIAAYHHNGDDTCQSCLEVEQVMRPSRETPDIHYGTIASGNTLVKDAKYRDELISWLKEENVDPLCFEMEAAGLMNTFPCMVIRGICDYGDSHKNDSWQRYAAAAAAAFAKEFLGFVDADEVKRAPKLREVLEHIDKIRITLEESTAQTQREKIHRWLSPPDASINHNKAIQQRHEGTGQWFIKGQAFTHFKDCQASFLWLHGIPGCGKTILSSSIVEHLRQPHSNKVFPLLYFYFDFNDNRKQSLDGALRSLISQLAGQSASASKEVELLHKSNKDGTEQPSSQMLSQTLHRMLTIASHTRIVLDALDECTTRKELLPWIQQLMALDVSTVQIIATGRREHDIENAFGKWLRPEHIISIQQLEVDADIRAYVNARIHTSTDLERWQAMPKVQNEIEAKLMEKANGMFRWAACQLNSLIECVTRRQLDIALASLPATLYETYARILDQLPREYQQDSIRILQVLVWSERPLRLEEAVDFLAVDVHVQPGFSVENRMPVPKEIIRLCSSLVTIMRADEDEVLHHSLQDIDGDGKQRITEEMRLAHFSVKEYLVSNRLEAKYQVHFSQVPAATCIASVSLTYLLHVDGDLDIWELRAQFPLAEYSARYWIQFAHLADPEDKFMAELIIGLLLDRRRYITWLSLYDPDTPWEDGPRVLTKPAQPLYYASFGGLYNIVMRLLDSFADVNAPGGVYGNALQAACYGGHEKMAEMLVDKGADVNAQGGNYGNALQAACIKGHEKMAEMLVDKGADVNAQGGRYGNALQAACAVSQEKVVEMLVDKGADVNAQGGRYGNALQAACFKGQEKMAEMLVDKGAYVNGRGSFFNDDFEKVEDVTALYTTVYLGYEKMAEMLVDNGADVNTQGGPYGNALQAACAVSQEKMAEMLVDKGADVNAQGGRYGNALQAACFKRQEKMAEMLVDKGANVNAQGGEYGNALQAACFKGYEKMAEMLVDKGADVNAQGGYYGNALQAACFKGYEKMAEMLVDKGANVNAQGGEYGNALQAACFKGYEKMAEMLVDKGADVNAQGGRYGNALQAACFKGQEKMAEMLVDKGANVNAQGGEYGNALQAACFKGYEKMAEMLVDKGANVNAQGGYYGNALQAACFKGYEKMAEMLVDNGADVNAQGGYYGNALQAACFKGHEKMAEMLVDKGADVNTQGGRYGNALQAACAGGHEKMAEMLVDKGADVNTQGGRYGNALQAACAGGHEKMAEMLVDKGADANAGVGVYGNVL